MITLAQARARIRTLTRHVEGDPRLDDTTLDLLLYQEECALRTELQEVESSYGLVVISSLVLDATCIIDLTNAPCTFERVARVEMLIQGVGYRALEPAHLANPEVHPGGFTWRVEACRLIIGPDQLAATRTVRVTFWPTPGQTTLADEALPIPAPTEKTLIYRTCREVCLMDGDNADADKWDGLATAEWNRACAVLKRQTGLQARGGLAVRLGY